MTELTKIESQTSYVQLTLFDLEELEAKVRAGLASFLEVGDALVKIRDGEGYKLRGYQTFEQYCEDEFHFSVRQGQRLIVAARTAEVIEQLTGETPANEAVAREFARVTYSPEVVQEVHQELKAEGKSVSQAKAQDVRRVVTNVVERRNGNGNANGAKPAPATATNPKPKSEPMPEPEMDLASGMDFCPNCGTVPGAYKRKGESWFCEECGGAVVISVSATA